MEKRYAWVTNIAVLTRYEENKNRTAFSLSREAMREVNKRTLATF